MDESKRILEIQKLVKELSGLKKKYRLKLESKQHISTWRFQIEAGAILVNAFRLSCFDNDGRLNRIIASFHSNTDSQIDYSMIFQTVCEKYLTNHNSGFDFDMKQHQFGVEKALIFSAEWFENYLTQFLETRQHRASQ